MVGTVMQIRPIRNDKDHRAALAEIEKHWRAPVGTPEGHKLDVLVTAVVTYEERRWPLDSRRRLVHSTRVVRRKPAKKKPRK
jgi:antitoxin component HigA of HigAB toxin-antitoxin module